MSSLATIPARIAGRTLSVDPELPSRPEDPIAAYLTPEYVSAACIPSSELSQRMLRLNLLFQRGPGDGPVEAIERGRVAVKTVLTHNAHLLTHLTLTPYELFRAINDPTKTNRVSKDFLEVDLLIVRANGDDRPRKQNGDWIDYQTNLAIAVHRRLLEARPTWFIHKLMALLE